MCFQLVVALTGFYLLTNTLPPHFLLAAGPPILVIAGLFATSTGKRFLDTMDLKWCVLFHSIRILVEINLYWLFLYKQVPALMTFKAGNIDILVGITAPVIWWTFSRKLIGNRGFRVEQPQFLSVLNAFGRAMLSAPFRFQQFAFDQPTIAIFGSLSFCFQPSSFPRRFCAI